MPQSSYMVAPGTTSEDQAIRRKIALALMQQGMSTEPVQHWTQGAARALQGAVGGYEMYRADQDDKAERAKGNELLAKVLGGAMPGFVPPPEPSKIPDNAYTPIVHQAAKDHNLDPNLLTALLKQESGFNPNAVSPRGAVGIAQFMPATAQELNVNPHDPSSAIPGAAKYLAQNRDRFGGDMVKALAAYNWGPGNVSKWDGDFSKLPPETQKYIQALIPQQAQQRSAPDASVIVQMLGNRYTAPIAQQIAGGMIQQQFKPQDYDIHHTADGRVIATNKKNPQDVRVVQTPGGSSSIIRHEADKAGAIEAAKNEATKQADAPQAESRAKEAMDDVFKAGSEAMRLAEHQGRKSAAGPIASKLPTLSEKTANFESDLKTLSTKVFITTIGRMRELSKTGGAVGQVTEREMEKLENSMRNLSLHQGAENLRRNLYLLARDFNDSMANISNAYKAQYGKELPYRPLSVPNVTHDGLAPSIDDLVKKYAR